MTYEVRIMNRPKRRRIVNKKLVALVMCAFLVGTVAAAVFISNELTTTMTLNTTLPISLDWNINPMTGWFDIGEQQTGNISVENLSPNDFSDVALIVVLTCPVGMTVKYFALSIGGVNVATLMTGVDNVFTASVPLSDIGAYETTSWMWYFTATAGASQGDYVFSHTLEGSKI